jgi:hypothetical protein
VRYADRGALEFTGGAAPADALLALEGELESAAPDEPETQEVVWADPLPDEGEGPASGMAIDTGDAPSMWPNLIVHPNPVRGMGAAVLSFRLSKRGHVTATLYGVDGRRARPALEMDLEPGDQTLAMPARDERGLPLAGGVYFCEIRAPEGRAVRRVVIMP